MVPRTFKLICILLAGIFALNVVISTANAANFTATSGSAINAEDTFNLKVTITAQEVTCERAIFTSTAPAASFNSLTVGGDFTGCRTVFNTATVTGFGQHGEAQSCDFVFYANGNVDLPCPAGQEVTVDSATCIIHIPGQTGLGTVTYTNNGNHLEVGFNLTSITTTHTDGFLCPFGSSGKSTMAYESSTAVTFTPSVGTFKWDP